MIRQQMEETRSSLQEKLETLEHQVVNTVQESVAAVTDTVESVKTAVQDTVDTVKDTVQGTVDTMKDTVQGTVDSVKDTVQETVATVKEHLDVRQYVERNPWAMFLGSAAVGYIGGYLLQGGTPAPRRTALPPGPVYQGEPVFNESPTQRFVPEERRVSTRRPEEPAKESWFDGLTGLFGNELSKLKGLAIGTGLSVVREMITSSAPPPFGKELAEMINNVTLKLGGQPIPASALADFMPNAESTQNEGNGTHQPFEAASPGATGRPAGSSLAPSWRP